VKNRFQSLPFKCNLQRYIAALQQELLSFSQTYEWGKRQGGSAGLNQVDP
jgi:hypothetical protein